MQCLKRANVLYPADFQRKTPLERKLLDEVRIDDDCFAIPPLDSINPFTDCRAVAPSPARQGAFAAPSPKRRPRHFRDVIETAVHILIIAGTLAFLAFIIGALATIGAGS